MHSQRICVALSLLPQADAKASSDWRALRALGSAASYGVNAVPAALEALLVRDTGFPGEVLMSGCGSEPSDAW